MWRCAVMTRSCDTEVRQPKERRRLGANCAEGSRAMQRSDRLSIKSACGLRVSRPLRAVCRRPPEVDRSGWLSAAVESVQRLSAHRGSGWAYNKGAQGVVSVLRQVELTGRQKGMEAKPEQRANRGCRRRRQGVSRRLVKTVSRPPLALCRRLFGV